MVSASSFIGNFLLLLCMCIFSCATTKAPATYKRHGVVIKDIPSKTAPIVIDSNSIDSRSIDADDLLYYKNIKRSELQEIAKSFDIKANQKSDDIIAELMNLNTKEIDNSSASSTKSSAKKTKILNASRTSDADEKGRAASDIDISTILLEQGLSIDNVLQLRDLLRYDSVQSDGGEKEEEDALSAEIKNIALKEIGYDAIDESEQTDEAIEAKKRLNKEKSDNIKQLKKKNVASAASVSPAVSTSLSARSNSYVKSSASIINRSSSSSSVNISSSSSSSIATTSSTKKKSNHSTKIHPSSNGVSLVEMLESLVKSKGFEYLFDNTGVKAFNTTPTVTSSLKALRKPTMEWARYKVEKLYIDSIRFKSIE